MKKKRATQFEKWKKKKKMCYFSPFSLCFVFSEWIDHFLFKFYDDRDDKNTCAHAQDKKRGEVVVDYFFFFWNYIQNPERS